MLYLSTLLALAPVPADCLPVTMAGDVPAVTLSGRLERRLSPAPPNSVEGPYDPPHVTYVLTLDRDICLAGGGKSAARSAQIGRAQLLTGAPRLSSRLRHAAGGRVTVTGMGFIGDPGRHRAPLLVNVEALAIERR